MIVTADARTLEPIVVSPLAWYWVTAAKYAPAGIAPMVEFTAGGDGAEAMATSPYQTGESRVATVPVSPFLYKNGVLVAVPTYRFQATVPVGSDGTVALAMSPEDVVTLACDVPTVVSPPHAVTQV